MDKLTLVKVSNRIDFLFDIREESHYGEIELMIKSFLEQIRYELMTATPKKVYNALFRSDDIYISLTQINEVFNKYLDQN